MKATTVARWAAVLAVTTAAALAGNARAQGSFALTLSQCGSSDSGFQFTLNGAGADPAQALEVDVTTSEAGATPQPFFLVPVGASTDVSVAARIASDGTFTFPYGAGAAQMLPATIAVYTFDTVTDTRTGTGSIYGTVIDKNTACTDGTSLAGGTTGGGGGGGGGGSLPTTADQCKRNGYKAFGVFKNEGDCVSFVATRGRNKPALRP